MQESGILRESTTVLYLNVAQSDSPEFETHFQTVNIQKWEKNGCLKVRAFGI